jgi:hypothetical protein
MPKYKDVGCSEFFNSLFGHEHLKKMYMYLWTMNIDDNPNLNNNTHDRTKSVKAVYGGRSISYRIGDGLDKAVKRCENKNDWYFGLAMSCFPVKMHERLKSNNVDAISALWLDIDFASPYRGKQNLPPDYESIRPAIESMPLPTWEINSGYGLHLYWVLDTPFKCKSKSDSDTLVLTVKRWNAAFKQKIKALGYELDSTSAAQVLRVPGSVNTKNPNDHKLVEVESYEPDNTHDFDDLFDLASVVAGNVDLDTQEDLSVKNFVLNHNAGLSADELEVLFDSEKKLKNIWTGKTKYPSQSERDMAIAAYMRSLNYSDQKIVDALVHNRRSMDSKTKSSANYYARTLLRASQSAMVNGNSWQIEPPAEVTTVTEQEEVIEPEEEVIEEASEEITEAEASADANEDELQDMTVDDGEFAVKKAIYELSGLYVDNLIKVQTTPPSYRLKFKSGDTLHEIRFKDIAEVTSQKTFMDRLMGTLNQYLPKLTRKKWEQFLTLLLPLTCEGILADGGTELGEFRIKVNMFLAAFNCELNDDVEIEENILMGRRCFARLSNADNVDVFIDPVSFMTWHNREGFPERMNMQSVALQMYNLAGKAVKIVKRQFMRVPGRMLDDGSIEIV